MSSISPPPSASLAGRLRQATRDSHQRLDHHPLLAPLIRRELSLAQYKRGLQAMVWIHAPLQKTLAAALDTWHCGYALVDRLAWLATDMQVLNMAPMLAKPSWPLSPPAGPAELVGMLYVTEGSLLGGQAISRQVGQTLGLSADTGARFFQGLGTATIAHWQEFLRFAELSDGRDHSGLAETAAVRLFEQLRHALDLCLEHAAAVER